MKKDKLINIRTTEPGRRVVIEEAEKKGITYSEMLLKPLAKKIKKAENRKGTE